MFTKKGKILNELSFYGSEFDEVAAKHSLMQDAAAAAAEAKAEKDRQDQERYNEFTNGITDFVKELMTMIEGIMQSFGFSPKEAGQIAAMLSDPAVQAELTPEVAKYFENTDLTIRTADMGSYEELLQNVKKDLKSFKIEEDLIISVTGDDGNPKEVNLKGKTIDLTSIPEFDRLLAEKLQAEGITKDNFEQVRAGAVVERREILAQDPNHLSSLNNLGDLAAAIRSPGSNPAIGMLEKQGYGPFLKEVERLATRAEIYDYDLSKIPVSDEIKAVFAAYEKDPTNKPGSELHTALSRLSDMAYTYRDNEQMPTRAFVEGLAASSNGNDKNVMDGLNGGKAENRKEVADILSRSYPNAKGERTDELSSRLDNAANSKYDRDITMDDMIQAGAKVNNIMGKYASSGSRVRVADMRKEVVALNDPLALSVYDNMMAQAASGRGRVNGRDVANAQATLLDNMSKIIVKAQDQGLDLKEVVLDDEAKKRVMDGQLGTEMSYAQIMAANSEAQNKERRQTGARNAGDKAWRSQTGDIVDDMLDGVSGALGRKVKTARGGRDEKILDGVVDQVMTIPGRAGDVVEAYVKGGHITEDWRTNVRDGVGDENFQENVFGMKAKDMKSNTKEAADAKKEHDAQVKQTEFENKTEDRTINEYKQALLDNDLAYIDDKGKLQPRDYGDKETNKAVKAAVDEFKDLEGKLRSREGDQTVIKEGDPLYKDFEKFGEKYATALTATEGKTYETERADQDRQKFTLPGAGQLSASNSQEGQTYNELYEKLHNSGLVGDKDASGKVGKVGVDSDIADTPQGKQMAEELAQVASKLNEINQYANSKSGNQFDNADAGNKRMDELLTQLEKEISDLEKYGVVHASKGVNIGVDDIRLSVGAAKELRDAGVFVE